MANATYTYWRTLDVTIPAGVDGTSDTITCEGDEVPALAFVPSDWTTGEINVQVTPDNGTTWVYVHNTNAARLAMAQSLSASKSTILTSVVANPCLFKFRLVSPTDQGSSKTVTLLIIKRARL